MLNSTLSMKAPSVHKVILALKEIELTNSVFKVEKIE